MIFITTISTITTITTKLLLQYYVIFESITSITSQYLLLVNSFYY